MKVLVTTILLVCSVYQQVSGAVVYRDRDTCREVNEFHNIVIECTKMVERTAPEDACSLTESGWCKDTLDIVMEGCHEQDPVRNEIAAFLPLIKQRCEL